MRYGTLQSDVLAETELRMRFKCADQTLLVSLSVNEEAEKQWNNSFIIKLIDIHLLYIYELIIQNVGFKRKDPCAVFQKYIFFYLIPCSSSEIHFQIIVTNYSVVS